MIFRQCSIDYHSECSDPNGYECECPCHKDIRVPLDIAKAVFDIAVNSMDFGSGFLDNAEVEQLRAFAVLIDVDPMEATPSNFRAQYPHKYIDAIRYEWPDNAWERKFPVEERMTVHRCRDCSKPEEDTVHV